LLKFYTFVNDDTVVDVMVGRLTYGSAPQSPACGGMAVLPAPESPVGVFVRGGGVASWLLGGWTPLQPVLFVGL